MLRAFPQLTLPGTWIPALPAGMTGWYFTVVPGGGPNGTPEPSRPGMAGDSSAPLPSGSCVVSRARERRQVRCVVPAISSGM